jgi:hypothetical protein
MTRNVAAANKVSHTSSAPLRALCANIRLAAVIDVFVRIVTDDLAWRLPARSYLMGWHGLIITFVPYGY